MPKRNGTAGCERRMHGSRGFGRVPCYTGVSGIQVADEKTMLKQQEEYFEKQLQQVKERIKDFEQSK